MAKCSEAILAAISPADPNLRTKLSESGVALWVTPAAVSRKKNACRLKWLSCIYFDYFWRSAPSDYTGAFYLIYQFLSNLSCVLRCSCCWPHSFTLIIFWFTFQIILRVMVMTVKLTKSPTHICFCLCWNIKSDMLISTDKEKTFKWERGQLISPRWQKKKKMLRRSSGKHRRSRLVPSGVSLPCSFSDLWHFPQRRDNVSQRIVWAQNPLPTSVSNHHRSALLTPEMLCAASVKHTTEAKPRKIPAHCFRNSKCLAHSLRDENKRDHLLGFNLGAQRRGELWILHTFPLRFQNKT